MSTPHLVLVPSVEIISVPEASFESSDVADCAPLVSKPGFPHQGAVSEYPQAALLLRGVSRFHRELICVANEKKKK